MKKYVVLSLCIFLLVTFVSCSRQSSVQAQKVKIGYIVDETGPAASYTAVQKKGIEIALDELKKAGLTNVEVIFEDSKLEPKLAVNAANKLIATDKVGVIFTLSSQETLAVTPVAEKAKTVVLAPLPSSPELSGISPYFFRLSPSDAFQGKVLASLAIKEGFKKAAILYINDVYGQRLAEAFTKNLKEQGGDVVLSEGYVPKNRDFRTALTKIASKKPQVLFLPVYPDDAIPIMKQFRELGMTAKVFGSDTFSNPSIFKEVPEVVQGVIFASPSKSDNEQFKMFAQEFQTKFGAQPDINAAAAYDAVKLIANVSKGMKQANGDMIKEALRGLNGYAGATGPIEFDDKGDVVGKKFEVYVVKGKGYEPVSRGGGEGEGKGQ